MASYLISHGADVNAVDEKNVSACLIASATGTSYYPPLPMCFSGRSQMPSSVVTAPEVTFARMRRL